MLTQEVLTAIKSGDLDGSLNSIQAATQERIMRRALAPIKPSTHPTITLANLTPRAKAEIDLMTRCL